MATEEFIKKAQEIHKNEDGSPIYDYSKTVYINQKTRVCIICPIHGEFWQFPNNHLSHKAKCKKCSDEIVAKKNTKSIEVFIKKAQEIHKNEDDSPKYDYSKVEYKNCKEKVCIICPKHGEFWVTPDNHLNLKRGCPECGKEIRGLKKRLTKEEFIQKANLIHNNKYEYVNYKKKSK